MLAIAVSAGFGKPLPLSLPLRPPPATMSVNHLKLSAARDRLGLSNMDIATALDVSEATVSRWMTGERTPLMHNLRRLADLLNESVGNLTDDTGTPRTALRQAIDDALADIPENQQEVVLALLTSMKPKP